MYHRPSAARIHVTLILTLINPNRAALPTSEFYRGIEDLTSEFYRGIEDLTSEFYRGIEEFSRTNVNNGYHL